MTREYTFLANRAEPKSVKRMKISNIVQDYQRDWFQKTHDRVMQGEPCVFMDVFAPHELAEAMDIPVVVSAWWFALTAAKRMAAYYQDVVAKQGYEFCPYSATVTLGEALDQNPETAPWGGLPKLSAIVSAPVGCSSGARVTDLWEREQKCPVFKLDSSASIPYYPRYPGWWEKITDHWDEVIEPHRLDYRVEELKALIKFLETTTGKTLKYDRLMEAMELANEQNLYWRKARDLIARTSPCPVDVVDHLSNYPIQWHRGSREGRDFARMFYEEIKEKIANGEAAYPHEKLRLQWVKSGLFGNTAFYQYFAEKYGAVFVCSWYLSIASDGYPRSVLGDPLRALAGRHLFLGLYEGPDWDIKEAKHHHVNGSLLMEANCHAHAGGTPRLLSKLAFEKAGIPMLLISSAWSADQTRDEVSRFIETRLLKSR